MTRFNSSEFFPLTTVCLCVLYVFQNTAITVFPCAEITGWFLDIFAKLQKANISFIMSAHPSVCMEQLSSHCMDFH